MKKLVRWINGHGICVGANGNRKAGERTESSELLIDAVTEQIGSGHRVEVGAVLVGDDVIARGQCVRKTGEGVSAPEDPSTK